MEIIAKLEQITESPFPLPDVKDERKDKLVTSIRETGFVYSRDVITVTLRSDMVSSETFLNDTMSTSEDSTVLNPDIQVALVNGSHPFAALKELSHGDEHLQWKALA